MKKFLKIITIALLASIGMARATCVFAQRHSHDSRRYFDFGDPLMTSAIQSADGHAVDVRITTANSMFSFLSAKDQTKGQYYTIRNVTVEAVETGNEQPLLTRNIIDTLYAATFDESISKNFWHAMNEHIEFPSLDSNKHVSIRIEVRDNIDRLAARPQVIDLRTPQFANASTPMGIAFGDIALADSMSANSMGTRTLYTGGRGNTYMFSKDITGVVPFKLASVLHGQPMLDITVQQTKNAIDPSDTGERFRSIIDLADLHRGQTFQFAHADSILQYTLQPTSDSNTWTAIFHIPGEQFQQGTYEIAVRAKVDGVEKTQKDNFQLVWQNMPVSLEDPTDAITPLAVIAQSDQVNDINSGSPQEKRSKLYAYWKPLDPTPTTAYNERMATFYQRVDYADFNFATGHLLNGAMTDRGKVYLLYGPPTKIDRTFIPGDAPTETWTYTNNVHRIFHFEEHGQPGEYKLANIEELAASGKE